MRYSLVKCSLAAVILLTVFCGFAYSEETVRWRESLVTVEKNEVAVKADKGRRLGVMEQRGSAFYENGDVATLNAWLTYDVKIGKTTYEGYVLYRFSDGSIQVARIEGRGKTLGKRTGSFTFV